MMIADGRGHSVRCMIFQVVSCCYLFHFNVVPHDHILSTTLPPSSLINLAAVTGHSISK